MSLSRRKFLRGTSASLMAVAVPVWSTPSLEIHDGVLEGEDPDLSAVLARAIDAARDVGATYADVRYDVLHAEQLSWADGYPTPWTGLTLGVGVRALYNGYWGYSALMGIVTADDLARLGREATAQAKTGAKGRPRTVELAPRPVVTNGKWATPGAIDPFTVPWGEKADVLNGLDGFVSSVPIDSGSLNGGLEFRKTIQTFLASDGASYSQTLYNTRMSYMWTCAPHWRTRLSGHRWTEDIISLSGAGWETIATIPARFEREAERLARETDALRFRQPVDIGRYDIVFDGPALASLVRDNIGPATRLDRAMGYQANNVGTSYLTDPLAMLGSFQIGSRALNVSANRSMPGGAATVKWDAEGVEPDEAILVKDGILTDFQTTRESASWLAPYYQKMGRPVRSHGGAGSWSVSAPIGQTAHNLVVAPSAQATSFEDLCSSVKKGFAVLGALNNDADQQVLNLETRPGLVYEIINGKLGRTIGEVFGEGGPVFLSRTPDFWKNLVAVGGASTVRHIGSVTTSVGGRIAGATTVSAPAGLVTNVAVTTDTWRIDAP